MEAIIWKRSRKKCLVLQQFTDRFTEIAPRFTNLGPQAIILKPRGAILRHRQLLVVTSIDGQLGASMNLWAEKNKRDLSQNLHHLELEWAQLRSPWVET